VVEERSWDRIQRPPLKRARYIIQVYARRMCGREWMRLGIEEVREVEDGNLSCLVCRRERRERSCFNLAVRGRDGWWRDRKRFWILGEMSMVFVEEMMEIHSRSKAK